MFKRFAPLLLITLLALTACTVAPTGDAASDADAVSTITVGLGAEPPTLDPRNYAYTDSSFAIAWQIYEPLVYHDTRVDELIPGLATEWTQVDETTYEFVLREGVTWHDGEPFTTDDVVFTLTRSPRPINEFLLDPENPVEVVDENTVRVYTRGPVGYFLVQAISLNVRIMPEHILAPLYVECQTLMTENGMEDEETLAACEDAEKAIETPENLLEGPEELVGTGPFVYSEATPGVEIVLTANEDYWDGAPNIDRLVFQWVTEDATRVVSLEAGDYDLILGVPDVEIPRLEEDENVAVLRSPGYGYEMLTMNQAVEELADANVRKAIAYAIDKDAIMSLYPDVAQRTCGPLSPLSSFYNDAVECYEYNPDQARDLLSEAGYAEGDLSLTLKTTPDRQNEAQLIQANLQDVGINTELITVEPGNYYSEVRGGESELALYGFGNIVDPDHMYWVFHQDFILGTASAYQNQTVSTLLEDGQTITDQDERAEIYDEAQSIIVDQDAVAAFLYSHDYIRAYRSDRLTGIESMPRPTDVFYWLRSAEVVN